MTVHFSHESMCLQCPAESWERSCKSCDVNRHRQSVSWSAIKTERGRHCWGFYSQRRDGQMEMTATQ